MSASPLSRLVFLTRPDDPADLRDLLQRELGLNKVDAAIVARHAPGISPQEFPGDRAQHAAERATVSGLRTVAVPSGTLPDLDAAETVHHLRCATDALEVCGLDGRIAQRVPWNSVQLLAVGRIPLEVPRHYVTDTVAHSNPVPPDEYLAGQGIEGYEAWIFLASGHVLRCDSEHMNYGYLGARKTSSGTTNFDLLIADIASAAQQAYVPAATRMYLTHGPVLEYDFSDSAALREYSLVQWVLARELRRT